MKRKITHKIRGHDYSVSKGRLHIIYCTSGSSNLNIEYFFMDMLKSRPTDAEFKTLESMRTCYGIEWQELIDKIKTILEYPGGPDFWKVLWKCDINKLKILNNMRLSKVIRRELASLKTVNKFDVRCENRDSISDKFCDAIDGSQSFHELWQNVADAGNEITARAGKWRENAVRKQYGVELEEMLQRERHKQEVKT